MTDAERMSRRLAVWAFVIRAPSLWWVRTADEIEERVGLLIADHCVETRVGKAVEVLRAVTGDVDAVLGHHSHRVRMQRLGTTARAARAEGTATALLEQRLGHLGTCRVTRAQEQHPRPSPRPVRGFDRRALQPGPRMPGGTRRAQQLR